MKTVLITRPEKQAKKFQSLLKGIETITLSPIEILAIKLSDEDISYIKNATTKNCWCLFTSANSVAVVSKYINQNACVAAVGEETATELKDNNLKVSFIPNQKNGLGLANELIETKLEELRNSEILVFQGDSASDEVYLTLKKTGLNVRKFIVYKVKDVSSDDLPLLEVLRFLNSADEKDLVMTFFSGKTVKNFAALLPDILNLSRNQELKDLILNEIPIVVIGDKTRDVAKEVGFKNIVESETKQSESMLKMLKNLVMPC